MTKSKLVNILGLISVVLLIGLTFYFYIQMSHYKKQHNELIIENEKLSKDVNASESSERELTDKLNGIIDVYTFIFDMQDIDKTRDILFFALGRDQDTLDVMYNTEERKKTVDKLVSLQERYTVDVLKKYYQILNIDEKYISENRAFVESLINIAVRVRERESFNEIVKFKQNNTKGIVSVSWSMVTKNDNFKNYLSK